MVVTSRGWLTYGLAVLVVALDQLAKYWILNILDLPSRQSVPLLPVFSLSMVWNRGVSFGLLRADVDIARWGLAAFSLVVAGAMAVWARSNQRLTPAIGLGLVIGGAIGNLVDRVRFGAVADFLDFTRLGFAWVFNVADSGITVGVAILLIDSLVSHRKA